VAPDVLQLLAYCTKPGFSSSNLCTRSPPMPATMGESLSRERGNYGREMTGEFCRHLASCTVNEGFFYILQIYNMRQTALLPLRTGAC
jgi:hypothetical protein